jgi:hypothetical protein
MVSIHNLSMKIGGSIFFFFPQDHPNSKEFISVFFFKLNKKNDLGTDL